MKKIMIILSLIFISACSISPQIKRSNTELISVEAIKADFAQLKYLLKQIHPQPSFTMDVNSVMQRIDNLSEQIKAPLNQFEVWQHMALLNPYFNDGHMAVFYPALNKEFHQHIANGGRLFPIDVFISESNKLYVNTNKYTSLGITKGDEIVKINGKRASDIVNSIVSRMHGDSLAHRQALAADRFGKMYWFNYGDSKTYYIEVSNKVSQQSVSVAGISDEDKPTNVGIDNFVSRKILRNNIGYLRIDRFYYPPHLETPFFDFMQDTWQAFKQANVQDVVIDVRKNPGGTDHYWQRGIAPFVADKPFAFISKYKMRLTERNLMLGPAKGEVGSIAEGTYEPLIPVSGQEEFKVLGKTYLLMGPLSYSSTVLFLTAFQDAKQAFVIGQKSGVRSCTTGRIHPFHLPGSRLEVTVPTAVFTRSAGDMQCHMPINPDLAFPLNTQGTEHFMSDLATFIKSQR